ncbi:DNA methyltransferase [Methyloceanibacter sp.]|uniref:site-specific DNA-methyltransferase n=1 Tax=Methyloceanibacter sp. TaxID=1965321 RepID=UPI002C971DE9|nr:DNA methyltransferase [Methyloceanibacter sp.]HML90850.1 DNA methyltransferase [Methyloceanibacter sp.]
MEPLRIEYRALDQLNPYPRNARTHSKKQIRQIAESIRQFGFTNPVLIDSESMILAGHGRAQAARLLGFSSIPCVRIDHMGPEQKRAYILADNKLAENAGWDEEILATELQFLLDSELDFEIGVIGFETHEIDILIDGLAVQEPGDPADDVLPEPPEQAATISREGDLWILGEHRLLCADATDEASFERLMKGERAQMVFTDPPYNVPIDGHVCGLGQTRHREFTMAAGEMTSDEFTTFLETVFHQLVKHTTDGSIHFVCMDWRHMKELLQAGEATYSELKNLCVWVKDNGGMGTFYRSRHELVFAFKSGTGAHINSFELGQHGRYRTNVWQYRGVNSFKNGQTDELALHPTVKPVAMIADAIKDVSERGGLVLDCFGGSGSTLIAAHKTGRRARVMELDAAYVDTIIRRWQTFAKDEARHAESEKSFDEIKRERLP